MFVLPKLNYQLHSLNGFISEKTMRVHYYKHHQGYIDKLNELLKGNTELENQTLHYIIMHSNGKLFNNASQHYNHSFFWKSLSPTKQKIPAKIYSLIIQRYISFENFRKIFIEKAVNHFGSGYIWIVQNPFTKMLDIITTDNAMCPQRMYLRPILTLDLWEHAYYLDYMNERKKYVQLFFNHINWDFANQNLLK
jgi:Fe-Mn family superoxide dismutase